MIESALFFGLGFLCAGFLALMLAPAVWRRAVALTRKRIEASVPLTLNEIEADKDRMRAEFAMSTRRLEMSVKALRDKAAVHVAEIGRYRDEIRRLGDERDEKTAMVAELESRGASLRSQLEAREQQLEDAADKLRRLDAKLEAKALEYERMREHAEELSVTSSEQQVELVARDADLERLSGDIDGLRAQRRESEALAREHENQAKSLRQELAATLSRLELAENKVERLMSTVADREDKLDRREKDIARLREELKANRSQIDEATREAVDSHEEKAQLAGDLAGMSLQMSSLLENATGGEVEKAVGLLGKDRERVSQKLAEAEDLNERLQQQIAAFEKSKSDDWQEQKQQNALLREQINDLTAEVVRLTADMEGPDSPIHAALARPSRLQETGLDTAAGDRVVSLADRIRVLQKSASAKVD
ncbi:hypothetical protein CSC94_09685 [Zhengella mangrovi]|uniref:Uncharacterized protein n=1 Tax=Zhengella mangrovi TaxID=1982044 RepID=A0A2G1QPG5_9HYPH|nr:hypothetical protein [Zhengella mangrovi]PHP67426.1 hypothetical protein CSC94_09685 [Zhengella mangrovi]